MDQAPPPFSVRKLTNKNWEVLIVPDDHWLSCDSEEDARLISRGRVCEHDFIYEIRKDLNFADELEQLANLFKKYQMGVGEGWFRVSSNQIRAKHPNTNR